MRAPVTPAPGAGRELRGPYRPARGVRTNLQVWAYLGGEIDILEQEDGLALRGATPLGPFSRPLPLRPASEDGLRYTLEIEGVPLTAAFARDASGRVTRLRFGGLLGYFEMRRRPRVTAIRAIAAGAAGLALAGLAARARRR
jgi:hypothetical protein